MQRHGIGRPLHPSQLGSTPHDRVTSPQIRSSHSLPVNQPRQSASRRPPVATNRPTPYRVRRDPPLIQQPFHHPPACRSASTPFTHLIRGTQIPIAQAAPTTSPSRGFLHWRFAYAGPRCTPHHRHGPASANLHRSGQSQIKLIRCLLLTQNQIVAGSLWSAGQQPDVWLGPLRADVKTSRARCMPLSGDAIP